VAFREASDGGVVVARSDFSTPCADTLEANKAMAETAHAVRTKPIKSPYCIMIAYPFDMTDWPPAGQEKHSLGRRIGEVVTVMANFQAMPPGVGGVQYRSWPAHFQQVR
jgi:hypothetical protein